VAAEIAAFLDQVPAVEGLGAKLNRLLFGFLETEILPQAMRAAELGIDPTPWLESSPPCCGGTPTRWSAPSVATAERVTAPGSRSSPGAVTRTRPPDGAAGLRADGQTQGGAGLKHLTINLRRSASAAAVVRHRSEHRAAELASVNQSSI
jgi:hypothetical protein